MPITGREVGPIRICQISHITGPSSPDFELSPSQNTHNLEETTCIALTGLMRQLSDIATYADEIFMGIFDIAKNTIERSEKLHKRMISLNERLNQGTDEGNCSPVMSPGPEMIRKEQTLLTRNSRPDAIKDRYDRSVKSPSLYDFVEYATDDLSTQPHLLYSDPSLFVNAWLTLMDKEAQHFKKAARKRSFKKVKEQNKIATLKRKVHDPKSKTFVMVDIEPQYATLPLRGNSSPQSSSSPHSTATLNRKKKEGEAQSGKTPGDDAPIVSPATPPPDNYDSPAGQHSFDSYYRSCSTPIPPIPEEEAVLSHADVDVLLDSSLPPPPPPDEDLPPPPPMDLPLLPSPPTSPHGKHPDNTPPPFLPPPVPEDVIKPIAVSATQRILRTREVPKAQGRDTLLEMIRSSSFSLKPVTEKSAVRQINSEPTYATYTGTDVASILQRRKYLMGVGEQSDYSSSDSDDGGWD